MSPSGPLFVLRYLEPRNSFDFSRGGAINHPSKPEWPWHPSGIPSDFRVAESSTPKFSGQKVLPLLASTNFPSTPPLNHINSLISFYLALQSHNPCEFSAHSRARTVDTSYHAVTGGGETFVKSPICRYTPAAHSLTAQWINPDGTEPKTYLVFCGKRRLRVTGAEDPPSLVLAGDVEAMRGNDGQNRGIFRPVDVSETDDIINSCWNCFLKRTVNNTPRVAYNECDKGTNSPSGYAPRLSFLKTFFELAKHQLTGASNQIKPTSNINHAVPSACSTHFL
ncbi:hypothetical protein C8R44DRAFT_745901 [Mycena epipterygia]|nr:hypothetical protein C8R44DRAFT_745901 [Mycena epipterygia]